MSNSFILNRGLINNIHTATVVSNCNYKANLQSIVSVINKRGICKYCHGVSTSGDNM